LFILTRFRQLSNSRTFAIRAVSEPVGEVGIPTIVVLNSTVPKWAQLTLEVVADSLPPLYLNPQLRDPLQFLGPFFGLLQARVEAPGKHSSRTN
jgi:hypothetical protein